MSTQQSNLKAIADAIREKEGSTEPIPANAFAERILDLQIGSSFAVPLIVTADEGAKILVKQGETTLEGVSNAERTANFILTAPGEWSIEASLEGGRQVEPQTIQVTDKYEAAFSFKESRLPDGYAEVQYISNPNLGYLYNFGVSGSDVRYNDIELIIELPKTPESGNLFGSNFTRSYSTSKASHYGVLGYDSSDNSLTWTHGNSSTSVAADGILKIPTEPGKMNVLISASKKIFKVNETESNMSVTSVSEDTPSLFARHYSYNNNKTTTTSNTTHIYGSGPTDFKLYTLRVYLSNGTLTKEYVPCINPEGIVGIYEMNSKKFYSSNDTAKPFVSGPII